MHVCHPGEQIDISRSRGRKFLSPVRVMTQRWLHSEGPRRVRVGTRHCRNLIKLRDNICCRPWPARGFIRPRTPAWLYCRLRTSPSDIKIPRTGCRGTFRTRGAPFLILNMLSLRLADRLLKKLLQIGNL